MLDFAIHGAAEIRACARQLGIEQKLLRAGAARAVERGVRKLRVTIPAGAKRLPSGYAPVMAADVKVTSSVRFSGREPRVAVKVSAEGAAGGGNRDVEAIDAGKLRHPLFGNRKHWYAQVVRPGFASEPFADAKPEILDELEGEWNAMVSRVERG